MGLVKNGYEVVVKFEGSRFKVDVSRCVGEEESIVDVYDVSKLIDKYLWCG